MPLTPNQTARWAGLFYFLLIPVGFFGLAYVPSSIIMDGDPAATFANIEAFELLFRSGNVATLIMNLIAIALAISLYELFRETGRLLSISMLILLLVGTTISMLGTVGSAAAILFSTMGSQDVLPIAQRVLSTDIALDLWKYTSHVAAIFWGLWLFPLGILSYRSGYFPRILGALLMISGMSYVFDSFAFFFRPDLQIATTNYLWVGEATFTLWLLMFGVRNKATSA